MFYQLALFISFLAFGGISSFVSKRKHLVSTLISLEFIILGLSFYVFCFCYGVLWFKFLNMFFDFGLCEGELDLSILVSTIRTRGNDYFNTFNML